jgi:hypothetical protein
VHGVWRSWSWWKRGMPAQHAIRWWRHLARISARLGPRGSINPDGLTLLAFERPSRAFVLANAYCIHPAVWKNIKAEDRSALNDDSQLGSPLIAKIPG